MSEYIKLNEVLKIAEQQGYVTLDDLLACDTLPVISCRDCQWCLIVHATHKQHLCMRKINRERVQLTDFCSHAILKVCDESGSR